MGAGDGYPPRRAFSDEGQVGEARVMETSHRKLRVRVLLAALAIAVLLALVVRPEPRRASRGGHAMRQPIPSASAIADLPPDGGPGFNRLVFERSPYLLQHARNPVEWYPRGEEGKFYVWTRAEIPDALGAEDGELFCRVYGVEAEGNFREEATGRPTGANVLHLPRDMAEAAKGEKIEPEALRLRLAPLREKLLAARAKRVRPHLDDKALTAWNGLMIGALAHAARTLEAPRYAEAAERAAGFVLTKMRRNGRLRRSCRAGVAGLNAYLNDYVFLADGLLDLHEVTGRERWLREAEGLMEVVLEQFQDKANGGVFLTSADHEDLLTRSRSPFDEAVPSGNGVAALVLVRLAEKTDRQERLKPARRALDVFGSFMERAPRGTLTLVMAASRILDSSRAESAGAADATSRHRPVAAALFLDRGAIAPGGTFRFALKVTLDEGWHVNAHKLLEEGLVPTLLTLDAPPGIELTKNDLPGRTAGEARFQHEAVAGL